jgi:hypothetical protein
MKRGMLLWKKSVDTIFLLTSALAYLNILYMTEWLHKQLSCFGFTAPRFKSC